jgi:tetratricopeptide (TPR) repeat protein
LITLRIPLSEIVVDPKQEADLTELPYPEAIDRLRELYAFLGSDLEITIENATAVIQLEAPSSSESGARKMREKAVAAANRGRYSQAAQLYQRLVDQRPHDPDARRELGMSYLEMGKVDPAEQHVLEALRLDPRPGPPHCAAGVGGHPQRTRLRAEPGLSRYLLARRLWYGAQRWLCQPEPARFSLAVPLGRQQTGPGPRPQILHAGRSGGLSLGPQQQTNGQ